MASQEVLRDPRADHGDSDDGSAYDDHASDNKSATTATTAEENMKAEWEDWDEEVDATFVCLFCSTTFDSPGATWVHCLNDHAFDFVRTKAELGINCFRIDSQFNITCRA